ncbi:MAG: CDP-archaeol synthase [Promethearchaeota archaeon]
MIPAIFFPGVYLIPDLNIVIFLLILTPSVSLISNTIAYLINLKDVPW